MVVVAVRYALFDYSRALHADRQLRRPINRQMEAPVVAIYTWRDIRGRRAIVFLADIWNLSMIFFLSSFEDKKRV